jgi:hypothetical protein
MGWNRITLSETLLLYPVNDNNPESGFHLQTPHKTTTTKL